ncbi:MAG: signal peptide peptidase SppA [Phycisphaerae bacterium]|nr:signal peptide peptidase SppA [Phycisphaerae bacterium]
MRTLKAKRLSAAVMAAVIFSCPACFGSEAGETAKTAPVPAVVAHFHLSGELSESPVPDPFGLMAGELTSLKDLVGRLNKASADSQVKAVVLTFDQMVFGTGQLGELRRAVEHLKSSGKKVYAYAEDMETLEYGLLCASDRLSVAPQSTLWLTGLYGESLYAKGLLDKIGVQADFLHMGDYKSAAEMLTRTGPSQPAADNINWLFDGLYGSLVDMIAQSRGKTAAQVRDWIDHGPYTAGQAKEKGLIDVVQTRAEFLAGIESDLGGPMRVDNRYGREERNKINLASPLGFFSLLSEMFKAPAAAPQKDAVAVIYVEGAIVPGYSRPTLFGAYSAAFGGDIRKALETAAEDESVKAVVLRVDSPGGSVEASEVILNAARRVKAQKPLIVSMGDVAASGGYYVSCSADAIFADEATITASIGVVGGKLVTTDLWGKLGVNWVGHKRGANADLLTSARPFDDAQRKVLSDYMQQAYEVFKGHVTKGREGKLRKPIDEMAGGRVYTGTQALDLGLVDQIGGLQQAVEYAAAKVSLKNYEIRVIPEPKDFFTELMGDLSGEGERPTDIRLSSTTSLLAGYPALAPLLDLLQKTEPQRARALYQALQRIELIRRESVIVMMPFDMVLQ